MDAINYRAAAVSSHTVNITCDPVSDEFKAVCNCGWRHRGLDAVTAVRDHWRGVAETFGEGEV